MKLGRLLAAGPGLVGALFKHTVGRSGGWWKAQRACLPCWEKDWSFWLGKGVNICSGELLNLGQRKCKSQCPSAMYKRHPGTRVRRPFSIPPRGEEETEARKLPRTLPKVTWPVRKLGLRPKQGGLSTVTLMLLISWRTKHMTWKLNSPSEGADPRHSLSLSVFLFKPVIYIYGLD